MLGNLIMGMMVIVVGTALTPVVADAVYGAGYAGTKVNISSLGASYTILGLTTLFYVLAVASAAINIALAGLRNVM
jgi:xanthine/uracil permease